MFGQSSYLRDNPAFVGHSDQAIYEQLWFKDRPKRLRVRAGMALVVLLLGTRLAPGIGLALAAAVAGADAIYHWRRHAASAVWRRAQRGDQRMARMLRFTVELRRYRVLPTRVVPGHGVADQLVVGPTGVWLLHNEAWSPDTEITLHGGRLFIGRSTAASIATALRDRAGAVAELLSRELRAEIRVVPLLAVHGGRVGRRPISVAGVTLMRPRRVLVRLVRRRHAYYTEAQIGHILEGAARVLPIGGRMFPDE
ncbi:MAG TPA: NERD domain-containing protein [Streptosporangiaceae bacterium]